MSTIVTAPASDLSTRPGWIRNPTFDLVLIAGVTGLALVAGLVGMAHPSLFVWVLFLDVWLLGYHHVVSTFTRLTFDWTSFRQHRFLVIQLPLIVIVGTIAGVAALGVWVLPTTYIYWQWFHYARQSYGIERIYRRKADQRAEIIDYWSTRGLYLLPLLGILYRSYQQQPTFLGMEMRYLPITKPILMIVAAMTITALAAWSTQQLVAAWRGRLGLAHSLYLLTHHLIFLTGYLLIEDITIGWLVINVWHNSQYILIVWFYNNNRFKEGIDPQNMLLSTISQSRNVLLYFASCIAIATVVYAVLGKATGDATAATALPITLIVYMTINFHHYIVDGRIWQVRRPVLQKNLGLAERSSSG